METQYDQAFYEINNSIGRVENKYLTHDQAQMIREVVSQALDDFEDLERLKLDTIKKFNFMSQQKEAEAVDYAMAMGEEGV